MVEEKQEGGVFYPPPGKIGLTLPVQRYLVPTTSTKGGGGGGGRVG